MLSRRNVSRIVAAISAAILAFHTATAALPPEDESLCRRASGAMCRVLGIEDSMPPGETPETFERVLRARTNRISRKKSH